VRQGLYLIDHVIPPPNPSDSLLLRLSCVDDDAQGQPLDVLWDRELDAQVITGEAWDAIAKRGFDPADRFAAYLNTLRWNCVTSTGSEPVAVAISGENSVGCVSARTTA
jgi:hypothetical protein